MADLINIKQMYTYSLFRPPSRSFNGWVKFPRLAPMHVIDLYSPNLSHNTTTAQINQLILISKAQTNFGNNVNVDMKFE
jgi:hypothetical protein